MKLPGLFIGRFQPLHNGHVYALKEIFAQEDHLFIVIGSAQACFTPTDPFTTGERIQMLQAVLHELKIPCSRFLIVPVPDVHNFPLWVDHIVRFVPPFGKVYTGSEIVRRLFEERNFKVKEIALHQRDVLSGTEVRRRIIQGEEWKPLIPSVVADLIEKVDGIERLQSFTRKRREST